MVVSGKISPSLDRLDRRQRANALLVPPRMSWDVLASEHIVELIGLLVTLLEPCDRPIMQHFCLLQSAHLGNSMQNRFEKAMFSPHLVLQKVLA